MASLVSYCWVVSQKDFKTWLADMQSQQASSQGGA